MANTQMPRDQDPEDREQGRYTPEFPDEDFLDAIRELDAAGDVTDTGAIADAVGCHHDTARRRLNRLDDEGEVEGVAVGNAKLWRLREGQEESA